VDKKKCAIKHLNPICYGYIRPQAQTTTADVESLTQHHTP
jgi:hypothetical protein